MKKTLSVFVLLLGFVCSAAPVRFFESSADTPLGEGEFWRDASPYRKPIWKDNAYHLNDNRYYHFSNKSIVRNGRESMEMSIRVKVDGTVGSLTYAVGCRDGHDAGCSIYLDGNEKGLLPKLFLAFIWETGRTGQHWASASEEFRIPWGQTADYALKIDMVKLNATLLVNGKAAIETDFKRFFGGQLARNDRVQDFYVRCAPPKGSTAPCSAVIEKLSVKLEKPDAESQFLTEMKTRGNLLVNTSFKCDVNGRPFGWDLEAEKQEDVKYDQENGIFTILGKGTISFAQSGIKLKKSEKYRLGAWIRTKNFKASKSGLCLFNKGWSTESKTPDFPADSNGKWILWEADVDCPLPYRNTYYYDCTFYGFSIVAWGIQEGTLEVRNPYLIAMSPEAERHSSPLEPDVSNPDNVFMVPAFLLHKVQQGNPVFRFYTPFKFTPQHSLTKVQLHFTHGFDKTISWTAQLKDSMVEFRPQEKLPLGKAEIQVDLYVNGVRTKYQQFTVNVVEDDHEAVGKPCNNLVTEIFNGKMPEQGVSFFVNDWQWICISLPESPESTEVTLDGETLKLYGDGYPPEVMRYLKRGPHLLKAPASSNAIVRAIPEILIYPCWISEKRDLDRGEYDVDYFRRHIWHSMNVYILPGDFGPVARSVFPEFFSRGGCLLQCGGIPANAYFKAVDAVESLWHGRSGFYGHTLDEISAGHSVKMNNALADALWISQNRDVPIHVWSTRSGCFDYRVTQMNLLSAMANNGQGQGHLLAECYLISYPTMKDLETRLAKERDIRQRFVDVFPEFPRLRVEVSSTYCTAFGGYIADAFPEADLKYALDRYWHMVATDSAYKGTSGVGSYCLNHADEEMFRWVGAMFRHYFIEGNSTLLSDKHGFTLLPGHIENCEFREEFKNWNVKGEVSHEVVPGYARDIQRRIKWGNYPLARQPDFCDHVAVFRGNAEISQKLTGLTPGKAYTLTYITVFRDELRKRSNGIARHPVSASLDDVEILHEDAANSRMNLSSFFRHRIVFRARKDTALMTLKDTRPGEKERDILLNCIGVRPYFEN